MTNPAPGGDPPRTPVRDEAFSFLELLAATWLAIAQPVLDTFERGAETFVFRRASAFEVIAFTLVVTFGPALFLYVVELGVGLIDRVARQWLHRIFVAGAVALFVVELAIRGWTLEPLSYWLIALAVGVAVCVALARLRPVSIFLRFLSIAPFVFAALFLFASPVSEVAFADGARTADGVTIDDPPPVVMVVFDELPTASLLDGNGDIDADLFPNFARLADDSTWYRNYSSVSPTTPEAVPALLTGRYPEAIDRLPTSQSHPDNLFTLLAGAYEMNVWEQATQLCPAETCPEAGSVDGVGLGALLDDARSVWSDLLTIDAGAQEDEPFKVRQSDPVAPDRFDDFVASIDDDPRPRLDFVHVLLPHQPWRHLPSGPRDNAEFIAEGLDDDYRWRAGFFAEAARQRHLLQLQRTDALFGELLDRLQELERYDESLIVATADHGVSFIEGEPIRGVSEGNQEQIMWTPLLVKAPHQDHRRVDDQPLQSVDLVPTVADLIGVDLPFEVDGQPAHSLEEARSDGATTATTASTDGPSSEDGRRDLRRIYRWEGFSDIATFPGEDYALVDGPAAFAALLDTEPWPRADDPALRLYTFGRRGALVGRAIDELDVGADADITAEVGDPDDTLDSDTVHLDFDDVDLDADVLPTYVRGTIDTTEPVDVLVAVNGVVGGWSPSFIDKKQADGTQSFFALVPERVLVGGANRIDIYAVDGWGDQVVLHRMAVR